MLDRNPSQSIAGLYRGLRHNWGSSTVSASSADAVKYVVVDWVTRCIQVMAPAGEMIAGRPISGLVTVNRVRVATSDGTWGPVRPSSNKPEIVVVAESPA